MKKISENSEKLTLRNKLLKQTQWIGQNGTYKNNKLYYYCEYYKYNMIQYR